MIKTGPAEHERLKVNSKESEFEGNTLNEAIKKAVQTLGVAKNRLNIKIVCEEKRGLFGLRGEKAAKIKVSFKK